MMALFQPILDFLNSVQANVEGKKVTVTGTIKIGLSPVMMMGQCRRQ